MIFVDISDRLVLSGTQKVMGDYLGLCPQADGVTDLVMDVAGVTRKTSAKAVSFYPSYLCPQYTTAALCLPHFNDNLALLRIEMTIELSGVLRSLDMP